jgi:hypothetical protein
MTARSEELIFIPEVSSTSISFTALTFNKERLINLFLFRVQPRPLRVHVLGSEGLIPGTARLDDSLRESLVCIQELLEHALMHVFKLVFFDLLRRLHGF